MFREDIQNKSVVNCLSPSVAGSKDYTQYTVVQIKEKYKPIGHGHCVLNLTLEDTSD